MPKCEALLILGLATGIGVLVGALLIFGSYWLSSWVLVSNLPEQMDKKDLRNPRLIDILVRGGYIVIATGCFTIAVSIAVALVGVLILVTHPKVWFGC